MFRTLLLTIVVSIFGLSACSFSSPEEVSVQFVDALYSGDVDKVDSFMKMGREEKIDKRLREREDRKNGAQRVKNQKILAGIERVSLKIVSSKPSEDGIRNDVLLEEVIRSTGQTATKKVIYDMTLVKTLTGWKIDQLVMR